MTSPLHEGGVEGGEISLPNIAPTLILVCVVCDHFACIEGTFVYILCTQNVPLRYAKKTCMKCPHKKSNAK